MIAWLIAFLVGQAIEIPIYAVALRRRFPRRGTLLLLSAAPTTLTHPVVWFVFPALFPVDRYWTMVLAAETFAVFAEAAILRLFSVPRPAALVASLTANAASVTLGLLMRTVLGWP